MQTVTTLAECQAWRGAAVVPSSFVAHEGAAYWLEATGTERQLAVLAPSGHRALRRIQGVAQGEHQGAQFILALADHAQASGLRELLPWLTPPPIPRYSARSCTLTQRITRRIAQPTTFQPRSRSCLISTTLLRPICPRYLMICMCGRWYTSRLARHWRSFMRPFSPHCRRIRKSMHR